MKRPALQNKQARVLRMAFQARKAFGTFEKRAPGVKAVMDRDEKKMLRREGLSVHFK